LSLAFSEFVKTFPKVCRPELIDLKTEKDPYLSFNTPSVYIKSGLNPMLIGSQVKNQSSVSLIVLKHL
jgi:DNA mismatch repair ATPase MutS